jgi:hypothetical protein
MEVRSGSPVYGDPLQEKWTPSALNEALVGVSKQAHTFQRIKLETLTAFYTDTLEAVVAFAEPIRIANPDALAHANQRS